MVRSANLVQPGLQSILFLMIIHARILLMSAATHTPGAETSNFDGYVVFNISKTLATFYISINNKFAGLGWIWSGATDFSITFP